MSDEKAGVAESTAAKPTKRARVAKRGATGAPKKEKATKKASAPKEPKPRKDAADTKTAKVLAMLKRKNGATMQQLMAETEWQPHSVRGFLAGTVRKKLGLTVTSTKQEGGQRVYMVES